MHALQQRAHPTDIDAELVALAEQQGALDQAIDRCLLRALSARVHEHLGMSSFVEYASRRLGYSPRLTKEKLRVARALERLPRLERALAQGSHSWSAARELTRIITPRTEAEWLTRTEGKTQREVERLVSGLRPGARPGDLKDPLLARRRVVLDLGPEEYALLIEAYAQLQSVHGPAATQAELTRAVAEIVLGHAHAPKQPSYQIAVAICAECQRTLQRAGAEMVEVNPAVAACATCDGELVGLTELDPPETPVGLGAAPEASFLIPVGPAADLGAGPQRTHVGRPAADRPDIASARSPVDAAALGGHLIRALIRNGGLRAVLHETSSALGLRLRRVTPKLRALVLARDQHRCVVPGCQHRAFTQLHHLRPQAAGGAHTPDNLVSLCSKHHVLLHDGLLAIERRDGVLVIRTGPRCRSIRSRSVQVQKGSCS